VLVVVATAPPFLDSIAVVSLATAAGTNIARLAVAFDGSGGDAGAHAAAHGTERDAHLRAERYLATAAAREGRHRRVRVQHQHQVGHLRAKLQPCMVFRIRLIRLIRLIR
jgi:hypothetical protein